MVEVSLGLSEGAGDSLCTRQLSPIRGDGVDK